MPNRTAIVTGANSGIGKATATGLAERGFRVVMVCRSEERGRAAQREIQRDAEHDAVDLLVDDLAVQDDVRSLAGQVVDRYDRLDVLVNNAGVYKADREMTPDGIEQTWAVNHLAPFLLTNRLLDRLIATAETHNEARVVNVGSETYRGARLDLDDPNFEREAYDGIQAYARSKLAILIFTVELARRLRGTGVTANCVHPGTVATRIWNRNDDWLSWAARLVRWVFKSPEKGARGPVYLATSPEVEDVTGAYFDGTEQTTPQERARDEHLARRLWTLSAQMTDLEEALE